MWLILAIVVAVLLVAALVDRRSRRSGHRVADGHDLHRRIPNGTMDNSGG